MINKNLIYIIIILIIVSLIGSYFLFWKAENKEVKTGLNPKEKVEKNKAENGATLFIEPQKGEYKAGDELRVEVGIDTKGSKVSGADVVISYDSNLLSPIGKRASKEDSVFPIWPENNIKDGKVKFSALTAPGKFFSGKGKIATLYFKALKKGKAKISFIFNKEPSVFDCNVASKGEDILKGVINGIYTIK